MLLLIYSFQCAPRSMLRGKLVKSTELAFIDFHL